MRRSAQCCAVVQVVRVGIYHAAVTRVRSRKTEEPVGPRFPLTCLNNAAALFTLRLLKIQFRAYGNQVGPLVRAQLTLGHSSQ